MLDLSKYLESLDCLYKNMNMLKRIYQFHTIGGAESYRSPHCWCFPRVENNCWRYEIALLQIRLKFLKKSWLTFPKQQFRSYAVFTTIAIEAKKILKRPYRLYRNIYYLVIFKPQPHSRTPRVIFAHFLIRSQR